MSLFSLVCWIFGKYIYFIALIMYIYSLPEYMDIYIYIWILNLFLLLLSSMVRICCNLLLNFCGSFLLLNKENFDFVSGLVAIDNAYDEKRN